MSDYDEYYKRDERINYTTKLKKVEGKKSKIKIFTYQWLDSIEEGSLLSPTILSNFFMIISLKGVTKADLILTGGGIGPQAKPFEFVLVPKA